MSSGNARRTVLGGGEASQFECFCFENFVYISLHIREHLINILRVVCVISVDFFVCLSFSVWLNYKRLFPSVFCRIICVCVWDRLFLTLTLA